MVYHNNNNNNNKIIMAIDYIKSFYNKNEKIFEMGFEFSFCF